MDLEWECAHSAAISISFVFFYLPLQGRIIMGRGMDEVIKGEVMLLHRPGKGGT